MGYFKTLATCQAEYDFRSDSRYEDEEYNNPREDEDTDKEDEQDE